MRRHKKLREFVSNLAMQDRRSACEHFDLFNLRVSSRVRGPELTLAISSAELRLSWSKLCASFA